MIAALLGIQLALSHLDVSRVFACERDGGSVIQEATGTDCFVIPATGEAKSPVVLDGTGLQERVLTVSMEDKGHAREEALGPRGTQCQRLTYDQRSIPINISPDKVAQQCAWYLMFLGELESEAFLHEASSPTEIRPQRRRPYGELADLRWMTGFVGLDHPSLDGLICIEKCGELAYVIDIFSTEYERYSYRATLDMLDISISTQEAQPVGLSLSIDTSKGVFAEAVGSETTTLRVDTDVRGSEYIRHGLCHEAGLLAYPTYRYPFLGVQINYLTLLLRGDIVIHAS